MNLEVRHSMRLLGRFKDTTRLVSWRASKRAGRAVRGSRGRGLPLGGLRACQTRHQAASASAYVCV